MSTRLYSTTEEVALQQGVCVGSRDHFRVYLPNNHSRASHTEYLPPQPIVTLQPSPCTTQAHSFNISLDSLLTTTYYLLLPH